jgi:hypothetical protein
VAPRGELLRAVAGEGRSFPLLAGVDLRLRPGDRPVWLDLELTRVRVREWRARAAAHGLALDVWLGLLLEYELVCNALREVGGQRLVEKVLATARAIAAEPRVAPTPELRRWMDQLEGRRWRGSDDLPSVVVAARLLAQLPHRGRGTAIATATEAGHEAEAIVVDRVAAASGQTLEAWAYITALSSACE